MKAPLCRICGVNHWSSEPHVLTDSVNAGVNEKVVMRRDDSIESRTVTGDASGENTRRKDRHSPGYMRDYMRRKRASDGKANGS